MAGYMNQSIIEQNIENFQRTSEAEKVCACHNNLKLAKQQQVPKIGAKYTHGNGSSRT